MFQLFSMSHTATPHQIYHTTLHYTTLHYPHHAALLTSPTTITKPPSATAGLTDWEGWLIQLGICLVLGALNIWGIGWVSKLSALFFVLIYMPFLAEIISAPIIGKPQWGKVIEPVPLGDVQWSLFLSSVLWCFGEYIPFPYDHNNAPPHYTPHPF